MKKILGIFDKRPLIWFHYVLLTLVMQGLLHLSGVAKVYNLAGFFFEWYGFIAIFLTLSISDQLIHKILGVD